MTTRHILAELDEIADLMPTRPDWAAMRLAALVAILERECATEDAYYEPINLEEVNGYRD